MSCLSICRESWHTKKATQRDKRAVSRTAGAADGIELDSCGRHSARGEYRHRSGGVDPVPGGEGGCGVRAEQLREDEERLLEQREYDSLRQIVEATRLLPRISQTLDPSPEIVEALGEFVRLVIHACLQVRDEELRLRLVIGADALDLAKFHDLPPFSLGEVVYIVRYMLRASVGAAMRKQPLPDASSDWRRLSAATVDAIEAWKAQRRSDHFDATSEVDELQSSQQLGREDETAP